MEIARRHFDGGTSVVEIEVSDGALVLTETDVGPVPSRLSGGDGVEYVLRIQGEERLVNMLRLLGAEVGEDLVVLLDDDGLRRLGEALTSMFGSDFDLVSRLRAWLELNRVPFRAVVM